MVTQVAVTGCAVVRVVDVVLFRVNEEDQRRATDTVATTSEGYVVNLDGGWLVVIKGRD